MLTHVAVRDIESETTLTSHARMLKKSVISHPPTPSRGSTKLAEVQDATVTDQGRSEWDPAGSDRGQGPVVNIDLLNLTLSLNLGLYDAGGLLQYPVRTILHRPSLTVWLYTSSPQEASGTVRITPAVLPNPRGREGGYS